MIAANKTYQNALHRAEKTRYWESRRSHDNVFPWLQAVSYASGTAEQLAMLERTVAKFPLSEEA